MRQMSASPDHEGSAVPVHPLFASSTRLWLRIWIATQMSATVLGAYFAASWWGGIAQLVRSPGFGRLATVLALLVAYHVVGVRAQHWLLRRRWALLLFVPVGWLLILLAVERSPTFALLLVGGVIQGFVFLPFAWAMTLLAVITATMAALAGSASAPHTDVRLMRAAGIVAIGVMIGTVLLYIHRANREAIARTRLLQRLEEAQRDLAERAREAGVRDERQRFARDIHDTLAQGFISVLRHLEAIELSLGATTSDQDGSRGRVLQHLSHARTVSQESLAEVRRLVWALNPVALDDAPLAQALGRVVAQWREATGVEATFTADAIPGLQPEAEVIFLRATQEALSNVARHAEARRVTVSLACVDGLVMLGVEDDGRGFVHSEASGPVRRGLAGMRERVQKWQGHLMVDSIVGEGTSVTVALPLAAVAAHGEAARPA
jgi:signal transduction histidine kinase